MNFIFNDNVRILCLSCNVKKVGKLVRFKLRKVKLDVYHEKKKQINLDFYLEFFHYPQIHFWRHGSGLMRVKIKVKFKFHGNRLIGTKIIRK
jgi:hypothetical protein